MCSVAWKSAAYWITVNSTQQTQTTNRTWSQRGPRSYNDGITFKNTPPEFNVLPGTIYGISRTALRGIDAGFGGLFAGVITGSSRARTVYGGVLIQYIWSGSQDMDKFINNVAVSITTGLRTQVPADNSYYDGTTYSMQTYSTPASAGPGSQFLPQRWWESLLFLISVMWHSKRRGVRGWKDSALALLFSSVSPELM